MQLIYTDCLIKYVNCDCAMIKIKARYLQFFKESGPNFRDIFDFGKAP